MRKSSKNEKVTLIRPFSKDEGYEHISKIRALANRRTQWILSNLSSFSYSLPEALLQAYGQGINDMVDVIENKEV